MNINWGKLAMGIVGHLPGMVRTVEVMKTSRSGSEKADLVMDLFFGVVESQDQNQAGVLTQVENAEREIRDLVNAIVALNNKLDAPDLGI